MQKRHPPTTRASRLHIPGCVRFSAPGRTEAVGEESAPCGAVSPRFSDWSVRGEQLGRGGRGDSERLGTQLPNTRAHSIAVPPSEATPHCPGSAHMHLFSMPPSVPCPPTPLVSSSAVPARHFCQGEWGRLWGLLPLNAASCWYLFAPRLTHTLLHLCSGVTAWGV